MQKLAVLTTLAGGLVASLLIDRTHRIEPDTL